MNQSFEVVLKGCANIIQETVENKQTAFTLDQIVPIYAPSCRSSSDQKLRVPLSPGPLTAVSSCFFFCHFYSGDLTASPARLVQDSPVQLWKYHRPY